MEEMEEAHRVPLEDRTDRGGWEESELTSGSHNDQRKPLLG